MIQAPRGTKDLTPDIIGLWQFAESVFRISTSKFDYKEIRTPIFESIDVFSRSIGDETDIVNKEMYVFKDRGDNTLALRPEQTAALVRAVIQNSLSPDGRLLKLWYFGPYFRYERPQKGRFRQFHQFGAECIASEHPESDAEVIMLACDIIKNLGINDYKLMINSLGNQQSRDNYRENLTKYLKSNFDSLTDESKRRLEVNPLRVLDSKANNDIEVVKNAPTILDYLDDESATRFNKLKELLDLVGIKYEVNPKLVRGLDYYSHTVFEFQSSALGAQDAFGGGGRYNELFDKLGGKSLPAVGFAFGVERLILIIESLQEKAKFQNTPDAFLIYNQDTLNYAFEVMNILRNRGVNVACDLNRRSFKAQFKEADKSGAKWAIVCGENEMNERLLTLKNLFDSSQELLSIDDVLDKIGM